MNGNFLQHYGEDEMKNLLRVLAWAFIVSIPLLLAVSAIVSGHLMELVSIVVAWSAGYHFVENFASLKASYRAFRKLPIKQEKDCPNCEVCECDLNSKC